ncbi:MAG: DUF6436 domain-containing protein [Steroidobacteraceae bacterium]|jgi:hypothetical protein|nr:DUF6436 domain-containing protein [Steroidobacteraceae bacterium]
MIEPTPAATAGTPATRVREIALVACWLAATVLAFAWHGPRAWSAAGLPQRVAEFDAATQPALSHWLAARTPAAAGHAPAFRLLHLREAGCPCNAEADARMATLRARYAARGIEVVTVPLGRHAALPAGMATPAAALLDADGALLYLGPVAGTAGCGRGATPLQRALDTVLAGARPDARPILTTGCFCT